MDLGLRRLLVEAGIDIERDRVQIGPVPGATGAGIPFGVSAAKALEEGDFKLLTGDLSYKNAADGHAPDKAAVLVELKAGTPSFIGKRRPESIPNP